LGWGHGENYLHHALGILQDLIIPESQHAVALAFEPGGTANVALKLSFGMLTAVDLNNELRAVFRRRSDFFAIRERVR
jgi:hypothetical protein